MTSLRFLLSLGLLALVTMPLQAQQQDVITDLEDPSVSSEDTRPIDLPPEFIAALPSTLSVGGNEAANPAPKPEEQYPLNVFHWESLQEEGRTMVAGILVDGLRKSDTFKDCDPIDANSMSVGITEWMIHGDRTEAVMTVTAFIAYSVCPIQIDDQ